MQTDIADRVTRGIRMLDEKGPEGWRGLIDRDRLDIHDPHTCVLGQVYGCFSKGVRALGIEDAFTTVGFGFDAGLYEIRDLNREWRNRLAA